MKVEQREYTAKLPNDWKKFHADNVAELNPNLVRKAVEYLRTRLAPVRDEVRKMASKDPQQWWCTHHFHWGMDVRNDLRSNGFGEKEFGIDNLDDYYVGLVEMALLGGGLISDVEKIPPRCSECGKPIPIGVWPFCPHDPVAKSKRHPIIVR